MGKQWKQYQALFFWAPTSLQMLTAAMKLKGTAPWKKNDDKPRQYIKKQRHYFANKGLSSQVFLPGEPQGQQSLVGCRLWGHTESDTTEAT